MGVPRGCAGGNLTDPVHASHLAARVHAVDAEPSGERGRPDAVPRWQALRTPWLVSLVILGAGLLHGPVLSDGVTLAPANAQLELSVAYLLLAPFCAVWDALSLLSAQQHLWLIGSALVVATLTGAWSPRAVAWSWRRRVRGGALGLAIALGTILVVYVAGALLPRPMAAIALDAPDDLAIDFHSHTDASWDGRRWFGLSARRDWHAHAGFNVAYVTEHATAGTLPRDSGNPARAGDSLVVLGGVELACGGPHLIWLGASSEYAKAHCGKDVILPGSDGEAPVITLATLPANLAQVRATRGLNGVELLDAAPRALDQLAHDRGSILRLAATEHIGTVASSNNHGWGRTSACWSVMTIPGWRDMTPSALDAAIRRALAADPEHAVRVIERRRPDPGITQAELAASAPEFAWNLLTGLTMWERVSWLAWLWALAGVAHLIRRPRPDRPNRRRLTLAR